MATISSDMNHSANAFNSHFFTRNSWKYWTKLTCQTWVSHILYLFMWALDVTIKNRIYFFNNFDDFIISADTTIFKYFVINASQLLEIFSLKMYFKRLKCLNTQEQNNGWLIRHDLWRSLDCLIMDRIYFYTKLEEKKTDVNFSQTISLLK